MVWLQNISGIVRSSRVGQITEYDKLIIHIWSKGSISPEGATSTAGKILSEHFRLFTGLTDKLIIMATMVEKEEELKGKMFNTLIENLNLSVRAYNSLKRNGVSTVKDLTQKTVKQMINMRRLGASR